MKTLIPRGTAEIGLYRIIDFIFCILQPRKWRDMQRSNNELHKLSPGMAIYSRIERAGLPVGCVCVALQPWARRLTESTTSGMYMASALAVGLCGLLRNVQCCRAVSLLCAVVATHILPRKYIAWVEHACPGIELGPSHLRSDGPHKPYRQIPRRMNSVKTFQLYWNNNDKLLAESYTITYMYISTHVI